ncbi:MAG: GTP 3',8-cyclase MoaA [Bdellovibrionaceae bacterium]|nr:GTP 3',8-cyclase MoaA [Bdellovibrionales bacterium]MCB9085059.1 GTP 3',8-cyclase MoaA [Pseudobdellovibrionaceae bacterium]
MATVQNSAELKDNYGRKMRKLRVSLLDACNFRCFYCMPMKPQFMSSKKYLAPQELVRICSLMVDQGIEQIRLTGGEPTLRKEFKEIMVGLADLPLKKLGLTSNGFWLEQHLDFLYDLNCRHINISLDSLNRNQFKEITRVDGLHRALESIRAAHQKGMEVKVNTVVMRGINDHEIEDMVRFADEEGIEVRFLELMRIGQACGDQKDMFVSAKEILARVSAFGELVVDEREADSTSFNFKTPNGGSVGFIASESMPFCHTCSRLRLSADGKLRACLMLDKGFDLKNMTDEEITAAAHRVIHFKPYERLDEVAQDMNQIGG